MTCVGLEKVRAGVILLAGQKGGLFREQADRFVRREIERVERDEFSAESPRISLRRLTIPNSISVSPQAFLTTTPAEQRRVLLEKSLAGHRETLKKLSESFAPGCTQYDDRKSIDLLLRCSPRRALLVEVKTLGKNSVRTARRALSQVYEYRYRLAAEQEHVAMVAICFDRPLSGPDWLLPYLTKDRGVNVLWPSASGFAVKGPDAQWIRERMNP